MQDLVAACSKDIGHVVFTARLSDKYNRLSPDEFICWTRRYLQLPPLTRLGNAAPREGFDYDMEECMGDHNEGEDAWLDIYGNHGNGSCAPTMHGKHKGHTLLKWAISRFANKVPGVQCNVEPHTHDVLLGQYSEEQCKMLFPKQPSAERNKMVKEILDELDAIHGLDDGPERTQRTRALAEKTDVLNATTHKEEKKAVRLDIQLSHGPDELLVDATITHSLSKTNRAAEAKRTWERLTNGQDIKAIRDKPAAAIETARKKKFHTYNPVLYVIKKQVLDQRRTKEPQFTPAAVTTFGELSEGCVMVQEWLAMRYKAHLTNQPERPDGVKVATLVGNFRADFRLALIMTVVRRAAAMQLGSGLPSGSIRGSYGLTNLDSEGSA